MGDSGSKDGDVSNNYGATDYWVLKLDSAGNIQWENNFGGSSYDLVRIVFQTSDLGYIIGGRSSSNDGDLSGIGSTSENIWILKLNAQGNIEWQKSMGGAGSEILRDIKQTTDLGYIISGSTTSLNSGMPSSHADSWVIKLDALGILEWEKTYGGSGGDGATGIFQTEDEGYIVGGYTNSMDGDIGNNIGGTDFWMFKIDKTGTLLWEKTFGGSAYDYIYAMQQTNDGGFIASGVSESNDGDVNNNFGDSDFWIVKFNSLINEVKTIQADFPVRLFPNPTQDAFYIDLKTMEQAAIKVYNSIGTLVYINKTYSSGNSVQGLASGVYLITIQSEEMVSTQKLIVH